MSVCESGGKGWKRNGRNERQRKNSRSVMHAKLNRKICARV